MKPTLSSGTATAGLVTFVISSGAVFVGMTAGAHGAPSLATLGLLGLAIVTASATVGMLASRLERRRFQGVLDALERTAAKLGSSDGRSTAASLDDELARRCRGLEATAERLEREGQARRQWVADTAHEVRTPLAVLHAELDALLDGVRPIDRSAIESLKAELARLTELAASLGQLMIVDQKQLEFAPEPVDLEALCRTSLDAFRVRFASAGLVPEFRIEPSASGARAWVDPSRARQVLANLLENSLRYTAPGGQVAVRVEREEGSVAFHVEDGAPAVPEPSLPKLFERFFRVEPSRSRALGGSGLGLAICKELVVAHGGTIEASPSPLGGLRITVRLPGAAASPTEGAA